MFENILCQKAAELLAADIQEEHFPNSVLFSGRKFCGKLTCALETARILSCKNNPKGNQTCSCSQCKQHKSLVNSNLLLTGTRDCSPEISAASFEFINAVRKNTPYINEARYFFLRTCRKLTIRFSPILWEGNNNFNKIASCLSEINELIEPLDFPYDLPDADKTEKMCNKLFISLQKLENTFLYDSIPISQIRNAENWAHLKSPSGKKTIIIENAERMIEGVRNALLKILEEPPEDTVFILTTSNRNAVMPTILSRLRTYFFSERTIEQQQEILTKVFHTDNFNNSIEEYLLSFLPAALSKIKESAAIFFEYAVSGNIPDFQMLLNNCKDFNPRIMLKIFLLEIIKIQKKTLFNAAGAQASQELVYALHKCWNNITVYNQSVYSAMEELLREIVKINKKCGDILKCAIT